MIESLTLADLQKLEALRPDLARFADRILARTYEDFVRVLYADLDRCIAKIEEDPQVRQKDGEDRLTAEIIGMLNCMNYDASHDEKVGGHSDIVVRNLDGFLWLGEAKIHSDYAYLEKGFNQLTTRYSPGTPNADEGGLIVYIRVADAAAVIKEWRERLRLMNLPDFTETDCPTREELGFYSTHKHEGAGRPMRVRHLAVKQFFDPKDRAVRASVADTDTELVEVKPARTRTRRTKAG